MAKKVILRVTITQAQRLQDLIYQECRGIEQGMCNPEDCESELKELDNIYELIEKTIN